MIIPFPHIRTISKHLLAVSIFIFLEIGILLITGSNAHLIDFVVFYSIEITFFYLNAYWLLPLLSQKVSSLALRLIILTVWLAIFSTVSHIVKYWLLKYYGQTIPIEKIWSSWYLAFWRYLFLFGLSSSLWYARYSLWKLREAKDLELEVIRAREQQSKLEIALLRAQLNPHLMYNALAGIHTSLYLRSPEAADIIIKLNKVIEASLSGSDADATATLGDEIYFLNDLIDLHRSLQYCCLNMDIELPNHILDTEFPPKLLATILENIFKHGVLTNEGEPARFSVRYRNGQLEVESYNLVAVSRQDKGHGIGLANLKQRLEKHFPGRYSLSACPINNDHYEVRLTIDL